MASLHSTVLLSLCICLCLVENGSAEEFAIAECTKLYKTKPDDAGTFSGNDQCQVHCTVHGALHIHNLYENSPCPLDARGVCHSGTCDKPPAQSSVRGNIDLTLHHAVLQHTANAFASICIQNSSAHRDLPLKNKGNCLFICQTAVVWNTNHPVWNQDCQVPKSVILVNDFRTFVEVLDHRSGQNHYVSGTNGYLQDWAIKFPNSRYINLELFDKFPDGHSTKEQIYFSMKWHPL